MKLMVFSKSIAKYFVQRVENAIRKLYVKVCEFPELDLTKNGHLTGAINSSQIHSEFTKCPPATLPHYIERTDRFYYHC